MRHNRSFFTDSSFCCGKYNEFAEVRLYNIAGCELAEKGRIIRIIGEILSGMTSDTYYSPFEREMPCALYLPDINTIIADGYNSRCAEKPDSRTFDIRQVIVGAASHVEEIAGYAFEQSRSYMAKARDLTGISDLLLREYVKSGTELLRRDRLKEFAADKIQGLLTAKETIGSVIYRPVSALTCTGYRFVEFPEGTRIFRLCDDYIAASCLFVKTAAREAERLGYDAVIARAVDSEHAPMHLYIPEAGILFVSEPPMLRSGLAGEAVIRLEKFYISRLLFSRMHEITVFGNYIKKMYGEVVLCARLSADIRGQARKILAPYISVKKAAETASDIIGEILN